MRSQTGFAGSSTIPDSSCTPHLQSSKPRLYCYESPLNIKLDGIIKTSKLGDDAKLNFLSSNLSTQKEKPFKCTQGCQKSFYRKSARKSHERMHSDERLYECKRCGSKYRWRSSLRHHASVSCPALAQEKPSSKNIATRGEAIEIQKGVKSKENETYQILAFTGERLLRKKLVIAVCPGTRKYNSSSRI